VMRTLWLGAGERVETVLAIGAHADDIEIGCGGTLLRLAELCPGAAVHWVVLGADGARAEEARLSAAEFTAGFASSQIIVENFRDGYFPYANGAVKDRFEQLKREVSPDLILTHQRNDMHQDHRHASELTWNTFRDHLILEYEIPKYDGDRGTPNVFVPLTEAVAARKVELILNHFATQLDKHWFTADLFDSLMRLRGMEGNAPAGRAEAFYGRKVVLGGADG
jgi:LmbE family N-acetylglucosaminyl deacetylase